MRGWYGHKQQHSMASKGIKTSGINVKKARFNYLKEKQLRGELTYDMVDELEKLEIESEFFDEMGIKYIRKVNRSGTMDRAYDEYIFEDKDGSEISVIEFSEPDWDFLREVANDENMSDTEYENFAKIEEIEFNKEGNGDIYVLWDGAIDFNGTEMEFVENYPELNRHIGLGLNANGILDAVITALIPKLISGMGSKKEEK